MKHPERQHSTSARIYRELAPLMSVGTQLALTVLLCVALGWYLDERYATSPLWTGVCGLVGAAAGLVQGIRTLTRVTSTANRNKNNEDDREARDHSH